MIIYSKYINSKEHVWYDSSNVLYSECIDHDGDKKSLKVVFKQGRTYIYQDVDVKDYIMFKNAQSHGKSFNDFIKKYQGLRMPDTDLDELNASMKRMQEDTTPKDTDVFNNAAYRFDYNSDSKEFQLLLGDMNLFDGKEGEVSAMKLLKSMGIVYTVNIIDNDEWSKRKETNDNKER